MVKFHQTEACSLLSELSLLSVKICIHYIKSQRRELLYTLYIFSSLGLVAIGFNVQGKEEKSQLHSSVYIGSFLRSSRFAGLVCWLFGWTVVNSGAQRACYLLFD